MPLESPPRIAALPAPKRNKPKGKNSPKSNKATTGNKAKEINKKEDNKLVTAKDSDEESNKKPNSVFLTAQSDKESGSDKESMAIMNGESGGKAIVKSGLFEDESKENERRKRDEFEKSLREEDERLRKEKEEVERRLKETQEREESEKVERETKWREDSARRARESEEKRQASARRQEEERRKEEERQMEERKREEDRQGEEEKRREEERREQERREQERREQEKKSLPSEDSFFEDEESRRKKDALLARLKAMDSEKASDEDPLQFDNKAFPIYGGDEMSRPKASKGYEARSADKNLHNGLPAFPKESEVISPPESVKSDPDGVFGVPRGKPVLIGRGNLTKKNTNQFSWLDDSKKPVPNKTRAKPDNDFSFGDYSPSVSNNKKVSDGLDGDIFNTGMSRRPGRGRRREGGQGGDGFDFGTRRGSGGFNETKPQNNSLGFLSDDFGSKRLGENTSGLPSNNSPLLPRRRASQERNGPAVVSSVFDNLDDDIEEFTL